ncbi:TolC family protein [bacterium]|nr:TolC family protein [bacterium]
MVNSNIIPGFSGVFQVIGSRFKTCISRSLFFFLIFCPLFVFGNQFASENGTIASGTLDLKTAVKLALELTPEIREAEHLLNSAKSKITQARSERFPKISTSLQYLEREFTMGSLGLGEFGFPRGGGSSLSSIQYNDGVNISYSFQTGGRARIAVRAAETNLESAQTEKKLAQESIIVRVVSAYLDHLRALELLKSAEENEDAIRKHHENTVSRVLAGIAVKTDRIKTEVRLEEASETTLKARNSVKTTHTWLNLSMGIPIQENSFQLSQVSIPFMESNFDVLKESMVKNNVELKSLKQQLLLAKQNVQYEKAGRSPSLDFSYQNGRNGKDYPPRDRVWSLTGAMNLMVFDGGLIHGRVGEASHKVRAIEASYDGMKRALEAALETAFLDLQNARKRVEITRKSLELASEEVRLSKFQYEAGVITISDLLDNQADFTRVQVGAISALFDTYLSQIRLLRIAGMIDSDFVRKL